MVKLFPDKPLAIAPHTSDLWTEHDRKVRPYVRTQWMLRISDLLLAICFVGFLIVSGRGAQLEWILRPVLGNGFLLWVAYFLILGIMWKALSFPINFIHYLIERHYQLSKQKFFSWFWDNIKGLLVGSIIGLLALGIVFYCATLLGEWWYLSCAFFFILFSILIAQLFPIILLPLFYKLEPLESGELKERLYSLCRRFRIAVKEIYHLGLGEKTEKGNAAFVGLGSTKRILIGDTLYRRYSVEEVEAVFAHELGHQVHSDLWKGLGFSALGLVITFWIANQIYVSIVMSSFVVEQTEPWGLFLFGVVVSVIQVPMGALGGWFSRAREQKADDFASKTIGLGRPLSDALEKLTVQNMGMFKPCVLVEMFTYSHPAPWRRIARLRASIF